MDPLDAYCGDIFSSMHRADQRRAAEAYLRGLLSVAGRKSVRGMATATASGRSVQSLQQFLSQSPWDPVPIRRRLLTQLVASQRPVACVVEEVAFPKHGRHSAAVERQYVRSLGRVCNCQLAVVATLTCTRFSVPVDWRLIVPKSWGADRQRRARARIPDHELPRPYHHYLIEAMDDLAGARSALPVPLVGDVSHQVEVESLFDALERRQQAYLLRVSPSLSVSYQRSPLRRSVGAPSPSRPDPSASGWRGMVEELVARIANHTRRTVEWQDGDASGRSQFLWLPARPGSRMLLCEWPADSPRPGGFWITNLIDRRLADVVLLAKLGAAAGPRFEQLAGAFGLREYAGRTFAGWHHHLTLVAAACTYSVLEQLGQTA
ncbi:MAG: IS701 family transposase [Micromonosporaceae bacterium]|nr:IS701 family transposase [Micromonosporaceae bacterium]